MKLKKMTAKVSLFFALALIAYVYSVEQKYVSSFMQPRWDANLNLENIENLLANEGVKDCIKMKDYLEAQGKVTDFYNPVYLVTLNSGMKAVFKPGEDSYAEVTAARASKLLGLRLVPPTVFRTINGEVGSLQFFVESNIDLLKSEEIYKDALGNVSQRDLNNMKLFYFVFGQWDIARGNQIIQVNNGKYNLALIDNAGISNKQQVRYGEFPFVGVGYKEGSSDDWDAPFPFDNPIVFDNPTLEQLIATFGGFRSLDNIKRMWSMYKQITCCIWRSNLWIQFYKNHEFLKPNFVEPDAESSLSEFKKIDKKFLEEIWKEALQSEDKQHFNHLIELTLNRVEQIK